jgi:hypothetical protein
MHNLMQSWCQVVLSFLKSQKQRDGSEVTHRFVQLLGSGDRPMPSIFWAMATLPSLAPVR